MGSGPEIQTQTEVYVNKIRYRCFGVFCIYFICDTYSISISYVVIFY